MNRDEQILQIRPKLILILEDNKNEVEAFMHQTLRPILKFQHPLLIKCIRMAPHFDHLKLKPRKESRNREALKVFLQKNTALRNQLLGLVLGLFTKSEMECYVNHMVALNKRIVEMVVTRFVSQINDIDILSAGEEEVQR